MARSSIFPRICIALGFPGTEQLLSCARDEANNGGQFFEFRLDYLKKPETGIAAIREFLEEYPACMVLATCRHKHNQGFFKGTIEQQIRLLEDAAAAGARVVDLEVESAEAARKDLDGLRSSAKFILSYHNFASTPAMEAVLKRMQRIPASAYKIVTTAQKPSDMQRLLALGRAHFRVPLILLAMGEIGFPTRVISPMYGSLYTYAAPDASEGTAAGQVSARQLRHLYQIQKLSRHSKIYGVIADPVVHSISPHIHNRAFQARRIDAVYLPFLVPAKRLKDFMETAKKLPLAGFSVTIPHKQKVLRYLDSVEPLARRIGAVNTVWRKAGKWRGANTDAVGVTAPLEQHLKLARAKVLVVGNGGAARAAAFALADKGAAVSLTGRNPDKVRRLARVAGAEPVLVEELADRYYDAVIHATPLGLHPHTDECFFPGRIPADVVFDMVYNPFETLLLRRAREQKKTVIEGLRMFLEQGLHQFRIWTGVEPPKPAMERAAREALAARR